MALAIHFDELLRTGQVESQAELSRLGQVTRPRLTQIMNLLCLGPDIQILMLPLSESPIVGLAERGLRPIAATPEWSTQRRMWKKMLPSMKIE